jgi:hypothetical protein
MSVARQETLATLIEPTAAVLTVSACRDAGCRGFRNAEPAPSVGEHPYRFRDGFAGIGCVLAFSRALDRGHHRRVDYARDYPDSHFRLRRLAPGTTYRRRTAFPPKVNRTIWQDMTLDLTEDEARALAKHLRQALDNRRYPYAPRLDPLKAILAKLEPPGPRPEPLPPLRPGMAPTRRQRRQRR